jgi:hypothetical protein
MLPETPVLQPISLRDLEGDDDYYTNDPNREAPYPPMIRGETTGSECTDSSSEHPLTQGIFCMSHCTFTIRLPLSGGIILNGYRPTLDAILLNELGDPTLPMQSEFLKTRIAMDRHGIPMASCALIELPPEIVMETPILKNGKPGRAPKPPPIITRFASYGVNPSRHEFNGQEQSSDKVMKRDKQMRFNSYEITRAAAIVFIATGDAEFIKDIFDTRIPNIGAKRSTGQGRISGRAQISPYSGSPTLFNGLALRTLPFRTNGVNPDTNSLKERKLSGPNWMLDDLVPTWLAKEFPEARAIR